MLTLLEPLYCKIAGTEYFDFYIQSGEPLGVRHLCPGGVKSIVGIEIEIGKTIPIYLAGEPAS